MKSLTSIILCRAPGLRFGHRPVRDNYLPSGHLPVLHPSLRLWQAEGIHPVRPKGVAGGDVNGTAQDGGLRSKVVIERMPVGIDDRPQEGSRVRVKHEQSALTREPARFRDVENNTVGHRQRGQGFLWHSVSPQEGAVVGPEGPQAEGCIQIGRAHV